MNRRFFLSLFGYLPIITIPEQYYLKDGSVIEVYYCDNNTFADPWKPKWIKCVVEGDKCKILGNKAQYFNKQWMIEHYYWKYSDKPHRIIKPTLHNMRIYDER